MSESGSATALENLPPASPPPADHRGSPIPTPALIATRFMELRRRRGLMIALVVVTAGVPTVFLGVRLILHAVAPTTYGPAGGYDIYAALTGGILYSFGFIVAALGATAGSVDLSEGMFRHLVVTGRSRVALYLARIPAGLGIIAPLIAVGFGVVCAVCVLAAPSALNYNGGSVPAGLSEPGLENWAAGHAREVRCDFPARIDLNVPCGRASVPAGGGVHVKPVPNRADLPVTTDAQMRAAARVVARQTYPDFAHHFRVPSTRGRGARRPRTWSRRQHERDPLRAPVRMLSATVPAHGRDRSTATSGYSSGGP